MVTLYTRDPLDITHTQTYSCYLKHTQVIWSLFGLCFSKESIFSLKGVILFYPDTTTYCRYTHIHTLHNARLQKQERSNSHQSAPLSLHYQVCIDPLVSYNNSEGALRGFSRHIYNWINESIFIPELDGTNYLCLCVCVQCVYTYVGLCVCLCAFHFFKIFYYKCASVPVCPHVWFPCLLISAPTQSVSGSARVMTWRK